MSGTENCAGMENKLIEYLDGRAKPAERRAVEKHLAGMRRMPHARRGIPCALGRA